MPPHHKYDLLEAIVTSINDAGWNILYLASIDEHPFRLQIYRENESFTVRIYIWHITHGGGTARPKNEYRIQITGTDHFQQVPGEKTLILGWWEEGDVFAGWDVRKHGGALGQSPSLQIRKDCLQRAAENVFSPCDKGNQEIAIAFRPDFLVEYVRNLEHLHDFGRSQEDLAALDAVAQHPEINVEDIQIADNARKITIISVSKKLRDVKFRNRVLAAYDYHCAMCGLQLKLVDAAHIIPVNHEKSTDETRNGLALCVLHHRAYDQALLTVWDDYSIRVNDAQVDQLRRIRRAGGVDTFLSNLGSVIRTPVVINDRPHVEYIRIANYIRNWKT